MANRIPLDSLCQPKVATLPNDFDDVIDYIDISSVDNESKTIIAHQEVDAKDAPSRARQLLQVGDVIVSTVRPNLNAVALVESAYENTLVGSTGYCVLRVKDGVDNRFVFYFCQSPYFVEDMTAQATGASYPAVTASIVRNSTLPAYSLEEQHEIAQHLDTVTNLISLRKQQIAKLDELVKARFVEMFGDIIHNTKQWPQYRFDTIASSRLGKMLDAKKQTGTSSYPYLANFNVQWFRFDLSKLNSMDFNENDQVEFALQEGDLLVCEGGEIGRCAVWHNEIENCYFQKAIHRVRCNKAIILPEYLAWWFKYNCEYGGFSDIEGAKATIAHLPGAKLKALTVTVPVLSLQHQFAAFVAQTDQQKLTIQHSLDKMETLKKALMQKYFE